MFELYPAAEGGGWKLPVTKSMCVGTDSFRFMFGGIGLGAALVALERNCERPIIWASAQFFAHAAAGDTVDLRIDVPISGKLNSQARLNAFSDGKEVYSVSAALGARDHPASEQWVHAPRVASPTDLTAPFIWTSAGLELRQAIDVLPAPILGENVPANRLALWMRAHNGARLDIGWLAIYADFATLGLATVLGHEWKASSLDNNIRVRRMIPVEWVLCDIMIYGVHAGIAHGEMRMFAPDGELIAIASQSMIVRRAEQEEPPGR